MPERSLDTHNPAAQASAFRFIKLLHEAYPGIALLETKVPEDTPGVLAQAVEQKRILSSRDRSP